MDEKMGPMKEALMKRRGKGLDINILVGVAKPEDNQRSDLAPPGKMPPKQAQPNMGPPLLGEGPMEGSPEEEKMDMGQMDQEMMKGVNPRDVQEPGVKPRSLGDRARQEAMYRMKK